MKVSILVDNPKSWFNKYLDKLFKVVKRYDPKARFVNHSGRLTKGDILFILSCDRILTKEKLALHQNNIVVHASDLPKGRGWSPTTWQVESGKNRIPITLFEASEGCDTGDYYMKDCVKFKGTELIDEIREELGKRVIRMIEKYLSLYPMKAVPQKGKPTYYRKRKPEDNKLRANKSIKSQFNKMRVADNEQYPIYFSFKGKKYILKVYNEKEVS